MDQSGKVVLFGSAGLSVAALLGVSAFIVLHSPFWSRLGPGGGAVAPPDPMVVAASAMAKLVAGPVPGAGAPGAGASEGAADAAPATPPPAERAEGEVSAGWLECVRLLGPRSAEVISLAPIRASDCGTPAPVLLRSLGGKDKVVVDPPLLTNCPMVAALSRWMEETVQPAARATLGAPVSRIVGSSYSCRNLYNLPDARRSQHAYANAVDLPVFLLADGRRVDLTQGWGPTRRDLASVPKLIPIVAKDPAPEATADQGTTASLAVTPVSATGTTTVAVKRAALVTGDGDAQPDIKAPSPEALSAPQAQFLRRAHRGACSLFTTVLGPEANDIHRTHLHLDLQDRHALNVCK
jgi:hypothetical protein